MEYAYPAGHVFYRKVAHKYPLITRGEGIYLFDDKGKRFIDGSGGALVVNIGHGQKEIAKQCLAQMEEVAYIHGTQFTTRSIEDYADALGEILPGGIEKIYFVSGGSEAVEAAIKMARQFCLTGGQAGRWRVASRWHSYHGNTLGALSATGRAGARKPYLPLLIDFPHFHPPYCYRCAFDLTYPECSLKCARAFESLIQMEGPETFSAVILEPVGGATIGAVAPPDGYLAKIREICSRYGILYIDDEVMTGMGRTGRWFAVDHWAVKPDLLVMGKGMSGGYFPLSAVAARRDIADQLKEKSGGFTHGHTFSHHPVACAVGLAVIRLLREKQLVSQSEKRGAYLLQKLEGLKSFPFVGDVRGKGLMTAVEFVRDRGSKEPFPRSVKFTETFWDLAFQNGLVVYPGTGFVDGERGDMVMVGPPFIIEERQIDELIDIFRATLTQMEKIVS